MMFDMLMNRYDTTTGGPAEKWRELMRAIGDLVVDYGNLPPGLHARLAQVNAIWAAGSADEEFLRSVKLECWEFLEDKHGNSTSIVDQEDRAIRAFLCLLEPAGDDVAASDTADWIDEMLSPGA
jgi:hypothetical protein